MFSVFKTGSPVAQNDDLGFVILLPLSSEGWDSRHVLPCQVYVVLCVCVWGGSQGSAHGQRVFPDQTLSPPTSGFLVILQGVCQRKGTCGEPEGFSEAQETTAD